MTWCIAGHHHSLREINRLHNYQCQQEYANSFVIIIIAIENCEFCLHAPLKFCLVKAGDFPNQCKQAVYEERSREVEEWFCGGHHSNLVACIMSAIRWGTGKGISGKEFRGNSAGRVLVKNLLHRVHSFSLALWKEPSFQATANIFWNQKSKKSGLNISVKRRVPWTTIKKSLVQVCHFLWFRKKSERVFFFSQLGTNEW